MWTLLGIIFSDSAAFLETYQPREDGDDILNSSLVTGSPGRLYSRHSQMGAEPSNIAPENLSASWLPPITR